MADITQKPPPGRSSDSIPFWRDDRVLSILLQIVFVVLVAWGLIWLGRNILANLATLGEAQFICRDGSSSVRCSFDFLSSDAQFDIQESVIDYSPTDSYWRAIGVGALNTLKVAVVGIVLATLLGTVTGIARLSSNWLVNSVAKWYVDLFRNTPLLLQLVFIYFVVLLGLPAVENAIQVFNLPIFLSQRGVNFFNFVYLDSFPVWLAFLVLGIVQAQVLWLFLRRREEMTGQTSNRWLWAILSFVAMAGLGWFVAGSTAANEAMLLSRALRVREVDEFAGLLQRRLGLESLDNLDELLASGQITQETLTENQLVVCSVRDSRSEVNFTAQLRGTNIPYTINRVDRPEQLVAAYADGACDVAVAERAILASERDLLDNSSAQLIVEVPETPVRLSVPRLERFNFVGGAKMTEFTALLFGLVLFTGAFVAEIVRAGIMAVPKGQSEAARALGLSESQRLQLIVLPQAMRVIIPPMTSQYLNLTKNSSLALAVAYPDLYRTIDTMINQSGRSIQLVLILAGTYLSFSLVISLFLNWYNDKVALVER